MFSITDFIFRRLQNRSRRIFKYWDGSRTRSSDPMTVLRVLDQHPEFDMDITPKLMEAPDVSVMLEETAKTADATRQAFEIPVYDGHRGLTEGELANLLFDFFAYMNELKKSGSDTQTLQPSMESEPSAESDSETVTSSDSLSGSMSIESERPVQLAS